MFICGHYGLLRMTVFGYPGATPFDYAQDDCYPKIVLEQKVLKSVGKAAILHNGVMAFSFGIALALSG